MTTATTATLSHSISTERRRSPMLRRMIAGAAAFDATLGAFCLAAAGELARWLSVPTAAGFATGGILLAAAATGGWVARRDPMPVRWIAGANGLFAVWCLLLLGLDRPNLLGIVLLAGAALSSVATAAGELTLPRAS